jgi:hypothetical protein
MTQLVPRMDAPGPGTEQITAVRWRFVDTDQSHGSGTTQR